MLSAVMRPLALAVLTLAVSSAVAHAVSGVAMSPGGSIELVSSGAITIAPREGGEGRVTCALTLRGTLETRLVGIAGEGAQIGSISGMSWSGCSGGEVEGVLNLAWPITIQRLDGVDPRIAVAERLGEARLKISGMAVSLTRLGRGVLCLAGGGAGEGLELTAPLTLAEGAYSFGTATIVAGTLATHTEGCPDAIYSGRFAAFAPTQSFTFLAGGEVREGLSPSPLEFGTLAPGALAQRTMTISSTRGGRVESLGVRVGRYFGVTDPNGCRGRILAAGGGCSFRVIVAAPAEAGRALSDTVIVRLAGRVFEAAVNGST